MQNSSGILRLAAVCCCCLSIMIFSGYRSLLMLNGITGTPEEKTTTVVKAAPEPEKKAAPEKATASAEAKTGSAAQTASEQKTTSAAAKGKVLGRVIEKTLTPYTANTSYDGIYLKNSTDKTVDLKALRTAKLPFPVKKNGDPLILILHTHATESFLHEDRNYYTDADETRTRNKEYNTVRLGNIVSDRLNAAGYKTMHAVTEHDYPSYTESYSRAAGTIESYLKKYPGIRIIIDMHRDSISSGDSDRVKAVTEINGRKAAQIMLVMGANVSTWQDNLKLAVRLQQTVEKMYPSLARAISLTPRSYNEGLSHGSLLIEMGTEANSISEVCYSADLLADALIVMLDAETK